MDIYGIGQAIGTSADKSFCEKISTAEMNKVIEIMKRAISTADSNTRLEAGMFIDGLTDGLQTAYFVNRR